MNLPDDKWTGIGGSKLDIVDLKTLVTKTNGNGTMKEGDSVNLTCINSCNGGDLSSAFTWFKNGKAISEGRALYLSNISSTTSGNYTCSITTHKGTSSEVININVEHGPKNTSGSARPSTEVEASSKITLTCSSYANPPVENYTWFKIVDRDTGVVSVGNKFELHFRVVSPAVDGQYFCSATNKHGSQNSSIVTLKVKAFSPNSVFTRNVVIITTAATVTALLIVTIIIAVRRLNKGRTRAPETDCEAFNQNVIYLNWPVFENSQSQEGNQCEGASTELIYITVDFNIKRKSNRQQQMDSHNDDDGVVYSSVCRTTS
ncbi:B-cell receptor CD22-like [Seriola dumerili]|uniref:B-cell receptor CD22-like n=1 Tax=Seriola dumerili TaxID=41447 RepID=UPI000BBE22EB|nr:B-cell receptor CD22-like [Seriola dumerili]